MSEEVAVKKKKGVKLMSRAKRFWHAVWFMFLGGILTIAFLAGGVYIALSVVKVDTLAGATGIDKESIGDELKDKSLLETIIYLSNFSEHNLGVWTTDFFPGIDNFLENELPNIALGESGTLGQLITIDMDEFHSNTFATLGNNIDKIIKFDVTFAALKDIFAFTLPDIPIFSETYTDASGNVPINMTLPDFLTFLQSRFDFDTITISDLKTDFGIELLTGDSENLVDIIIDETWKLNELSTKIPDKIQTLTLADLGINITDDLFVKIVGKCEEVTVNSLSTTDYTAKLNALTLSEVGINITSDLFVKIIGDCSTVTINQLKTIDIEDRIQGLDLVDILGEPASGTILHAVCYDNLGQKVKISQLSDRINNLKVTDVYTNIELFVPTTASDSEHYTFIKNGNTYTKTDFAVGENYYKISNYAKVWLFAMCDFESNSGTIKFTYNDRSLIDLGNIFSGSEESTTFDNIPIQILWESGLISTKPNSLVANKTISELIG